MGARNTLPIFRRLRRKCQCDAGIPALRRGRARVALGHLQVAAKARMNSRFGRPPEVESKRRGVRVAGRHRRLHDASRRWFSSSCMCVLVAGSAGRPQPILVSNLRLDPYLCSWRLWTGNGMQPVAIGRCGRGGRRLACRDCCARIGHADTTRRRDSLVAAVHFRSVVSPLFASSLCGYGGSLP